MSFIIKREKYVLTETQKKMYASEKLMNFRWISKIMAPYSPYTLTSKDLANESLFVELAEIGQFTELGSTTTVPVEFIFKNLNALMKPDFPLEGYNALEGSVLVSEFFGKVAHLHGYVAYRPTTKQLIVSTSGTATALQAIQDLRTLWHRHKSRRGMTHSGFWKLYKGIRPFIMDGLHKAFSDYADVNELVVTGHSMGGAVSYLLLLDLLAPNDILPSNLSIKLVTFGPPRPGDARLSKYWQELVEGYREKNGSAAFTEYLVKAYNDGVPALPPLALGYRHFTQTPLYYVHSRVFHVPSTESEYALFHVDPDLNSSDPEHPRGGHNYYNGRDQERLVRRMGWLEKALAKSNTHWEEPYRERFLRHA